MKRRIFIGSSSKAKDQANIICSLLKELGASAVAWFDTDAFPPSRNTIDTLLEEIQNYDGAVFLMNCDDKLAEKGANGKPSYTTRDNVLIEAGLAMGVLGKEAVLLVTSGNVKIPSDFDGITRIGYSTDDGSHKMTRQLSAWYKRIACHAHSIGNVRLGSRKEIHRSFSLEDVFHTQDEAFKHIRTVHIMCFCGNNLLDSDFKVNGHIETVDTIVPNTLETILAETDANVKLVLTEPTSYNLKDLETKIPNNRAGDAKDALFSTLSILYQKLYIERDSSFSVARNKPVRFHFRVMNTSMPFSIFNVEYENEYKSYNHVKVDLYSAALGDGEDARTFVIWQDADPENYRFFVNNFNTVFANSALCRKPKEKDLREWHIQWEQMQELAYAE